MRPAQPAPHLHLRDRLAGCLHGIISAEAGGWFDGPATTVSSPAADLICAALDNIASGMPPARIGAEVLPGLLPPLGHPDRNRAFDALMVVGLPVGLVWSASPDAADRAVRSLVANAYASGGGAEAVDYTRTLAHLGVDLARGVPMADALTGLANFAGNWPEPQRSVAWFSAHPEQADADLDVADGDEFAMGAVLNALHLTGGRDFEAALATDCAMVGMAVGGLVGLVGGPAAIPAGYSVPAGTGQRIDRLATRLAKLAGDGQRIPFSGWGRP